MMTTHRVRDEAPSTDREALIRGLIDMAVWLEEHPDIPVPSVTAIYSTKYPAVVDRIAISADRLTELDRSGHFYRVRKPFLGGIVYEAVAP